MALEPLNSWFNEFTRVGYPFASDQQQFLLHTPELPI